MYDVLLRNTVFRLYSGPAAGLVIWEGPGQLSVDGIVFDYEVRREAELTITLVKDNHRWGTGTYNPKTKEFKGRESQSKGHFALRVIGNDDCISNFLKTGELPTLTTLPEMDYKSVSDVEVFITTDLAEGPYDESLLGSVQVLAQKEWQPTLILDRASAFPTYTGVGNVSRARVKQGMVCCFFQTLSQFFKAGGEYAIYSTHRAKWSQPPAPDYVRADLCKTWHSIDKLEYRGSVIARSYWKDVGDSLVAFCASYLTVGGDYDYLLTSQALSQLAKVNYSLPISISGLLEAGRLQYNMPVTQSLEEAVEFVPGPETLKMKGFRSFVKF